MARRALVIAVGVSGAAAAYAALPFLTATRFLAAARNGDVVVVARMTDFPALRADLRQVMRARIVRTMQTDDELHHNPLAGLGLSIVPGMADSKVEAIASPQGLALLGAMGEPPNTPVEANYPPPRAERPPVVDRAAYRSWREFVLAVRRADSPPARETKLVFERRGLFAWRLARLEPPT